MPETNRLGSMKLSRRAFLKTSTAAMSLLVSRAGFAAETSILAVRVWPAQDYTRVTLEGRNALKYEYQIVKNPERLVVDLEGVEFNSVIQSLPSKITEGDPLYPADPRRAQPSRRSTPGRGAQKRDQAPGLHAAPCRPVWSPPGTGPVSKGPA